MSSAVGVFGLGLIGFAASQRLLEAGWQVLGSDPDSERCDLLNAEGGLAGPASEVWATGLVLSCVFDTDQLADLIRSAPDVEHGTIISMSTCDPARISGLGAAARRKGWRLVEAPISGTSAQLAQGEAVFLVGGDSEGVAAAAPLLHRLGRTLHHVGGLGDGNRAKLAVNLVLGLNRAAMAEGLVFAESLGLKPERFLELLGDTAASSAVMKTKGPKMVARDFDPQGRVTQSVKDFGLILESGQGAGLSLPFATLYAAMMQDCISHDEGGLDNAAILCAIERARS